MFIQGNINGLHRIADIVCWTPVSIQAGSSVKTLSFQRGYLRLLQVRLDLLLSVRNAVTILSVLLVRFCG